MKKFHRKLKEQDKVNIARDTSSQYVRGELFCDFESDPETTRSTLLGLGAQLDSSCWKAPGLTPRVTGKWAKH